MIKCKHEGKIDILLSMITILIGIFIMEICVQIVIFMIVSDYLENALVASNLYSAVIDLEEYGRTGNILIGSPAHAFDEYKQSLQFNLHLENIGDNTESKLIEGEVIILDYILYNVEGDRVVIYELTDSGRLEFKREGTLGDIKTPDNAVIESTTVYSKIQCVVKGIMGIKILATKEKSIDIVNNM